MNKKKRKKGDISFSILIDKDGEQIDDFKEDADEPKPPFIKPKDAETKRGSS